MPYLLAVKGLFIAREYNHSTECLYLTATLVLSDLSQHTANFQTERVCLR